MEPNNNEMLNLNSMESQNVVQNQNNDFEKKNHNNLKIIIIALIVLLVLAFGIVFAGSLFKSDEEKFYELLIKKQALASMFEEMKDGQRETQIKVDVNDIAETVGEEIDTKLKIGLNLTEVKKKEDFSGNIELVLNNEDIIALEYAKTDDLFGAKVTDMTEDFIGFENKDLQEMFENLDIPDADELPNKILMPEDFEKVTKIKKSDANKMLDKYIKVLANNSKDAVEVEKNVEVKINKEKVKTNKYTLALTEKDSFEISKAVLETLKDDEKNIKLVMDNYKAILELMEENNYPVEDMYGMTSEELPDVDEIIEMIEKEYEYMLEMAEDYDFDDERIVAEISVYEFKGKTIATEIEVDDEKIIFKSFSDKEVYVGLIVEEDDDEMFEIAFKGTVEKDELDANFVVEIEGEKLELFTLEHKQTTSTKNLIKLNDKNMLLLNDADEDELEEYVEEFTKNAEKWAEDLEKSLGNADMAEDIFDDLIGGSTVSSAQFSGFAQEFGDYALYFKYDAVASLRERFGIEGIALTDAQLYYMAATGAEYEKSILVPEGVEFVTKLNTLEDPNLYGMSIWKNENIVCWEIKDSQIDSYQDGHKFYGDNLGVEKHFVTQDGVVFTLPGFPRVVDDEHRMYINESTYYITDEDHFDIIGSNDGIKVEEKNADMLGM